MTRRCIVLIDFSEHSENLLKYAYGISSQIGAELTLLHKTDVVISGRLADSKRDELEQRTISETEEKLRDFTIAALGEIPANFAFKVVYDNDLSSTLSDMQDGSFNNLVFIGLKGTGLLKKIFIGSVAVDVIENTDCTVVAIPMSSVQAYPTKLLVGVDNEYPLNINALKRLLEFRETKTPDIQFFTFVSGSENASSTEEHLRELSAEFSQITPTNYLIYRSENTLPEIQKIMNSVPDSILVLQKGMRISKDQVQKQAFINDLIFEGKTPLIILP